MALHNATEIVQRKLPHHSRLLVDKMVDKINILFMFAKLCSVISVNTDGMVT